MRTIWTYEFSFVVESFFNHFKFQWNCGSRCMEKAGLRYSKRDKYRSVDIYAIGHKSLIPQYPYLVSYLAARSTKGY